MVGWKLDERTGRWVFWLLMGGTFTVFMAMFALGLTGMPRRLAYVPFASWWPLLVIQEFGVLLDIAALVAYAYHISGSFRDRELNRVGRDAWGTSRSLEWLTHSPVPEYNFAVIPHINGRDEAAWRREYGLSDVAPDRYEDIDIPLNSPVPLLTGVCTAVFGFGMIWRIWWLAALALAAIFAIVIIRSFGGGTGTTIPADEVRRREQRALLPPARPRPRMEVPGAVAAFVAGSRKGDPA